MAGHIRPKRGVASLACPDTRVSSAMQSRGYPASQTGLRNLRKLDGAPGMTTQ
jgi:hypothetical protein